MGIRLCLALVAGLTVTALLVPATQGATVATADLGISWIGTPTQVTAKEPFMAQVTVGNSGPDPSHFRTHVLLPSGVRLVSAGSLECTGVSDLTCADDNLDPGSEPEGAATVVAAELLARTRSRQNSPSSPRRIRTSPTTRHP